MRIDFPFFQGEYPLGWFNKANQFVLLYNTMPQYRLRLASFHVEGKTMLWFQDLKNMRIITDLKTFVKAFVIRFGPSSYDEPMETLTRLRQTGSVEEYKVEFELI